MARAPPRRVCLGVIAGAHGVRGQVRIKSFTDNPKDLTAYGPLTDEGGARRFEVTLTGQAKGVVLARIEGVTDRDRAHALRGTHLYVERGALPEPDEDEYYQADLIGLRAEDPAGRPIGEVVEVHDYGAGPVLEISRAGAEPLLLPFTKANVPVVDLVAGRLVVAPPEEVVAAPE